MKIYENLRFKKAKVVFHIFVFDKNLWKFTIEKGRSSFSYFFVENYEFLQTFTNSCNILSKFTKMYDKKAAVVFNI